VNELPSLQSKRKESALWPSKLYVLAMLREVIAISEAEQKSARGHARCNSNEPEQPKPQGNHRHDDEGYLALLGYCK